MKIMLFGGTGFIGKRLQEILKQRGHQIVLKDMRRDQGLETEMQSCDGVINLGGAPLFGKRWTTKFKEELYNSRIESTEKIVEAMAKAKQNSADHPQVFVNASAIGYYGNSQSDVFDESSEPGTDFLAFICRDWEEAANRAQLHYGIRTVMTRFGLVLGKEGGALEKLLLPFKCFVGGPVGNGKQWTSWVHIDDVCGIIAHALENKKVDGPLNCVAPEAVSNREFSQALGEALGRPSFMPVPKLAVFALIGEAASLVANGQHVVPKRTLESGYRFQYVKISEALDNILNNVKPKLSPSAA